SLRLWPASLPLSGYGRPLSLRHGRACPGHPPPAGGTAAEVVQPPVRGWPGLVLRDAHKCEAFDALEHGLEAQVASNEHDWPWLAAISGPAAEACADPGCMGQRAGRMRVLLRFGFAFEGLADALDHRLIGGGEDIAHRPLRLSIAIMQHLLDLDGRDQGGTGEVLQGAVVTHRHRLDGEPLGLHHPEHLFDIPPPAVVRDKRARRGPIPDRPGGQQPPVQRRLAGRCARSGASISRTSSRVSPTDAGKAAACCGWLRFGRGISTRPARSATVAVRALRPGTAGTATVSRPSSGWRAQASNSQLPSASFRL